MSKRGPARRTGKTETGAEIEIGAGALVALALILAIAGGGIWWRMRGGPATVPVGGPAAAPSSATTVAIGAPGSNTGTGVTPEGDPFVGLASAPITIVEYSDYQCPNCRQFALEVLPWLKTTWMAQGVVRVVFRDFPIRGPESVAAAHAARCAGEQGRYWSMHDRLFEAQSGENTGAFDRTHLAGIALAAGLDVDRFEACMDADRFRAAIEAAAAGARAEGFEGTPTYFVNGRKTQGAIPAAEWDRLFRLYQQDFARATQGAAATGAP